MLTRCMLPMIVWQGWASRLSEDTIAALAPAVAGTPFGAGEVLSRRPKPQAATWLASCCGPLFDSGGLLWPLSTAVD